MFIDKKKKDEKIPISYGQRPDNSGNKTFFYTIFALAAMALLATILIVVQEQSGLNFLQLLKFGGGKNISQIATTTDLSGKLPVELGNGNKNGDPLDISGANIKAEDLTFGHFYKKEEDNFVPTLESYSLPMNIKVDVSNYYDMSRRINLDPYIEKINNDGFALIPNPFSATEANDFFSLYGLLATKEIPLVVTNDFLFYYNDNILKQVFKDIEKSAFYDNVWSIMNRLYKIASARHKKISNTVGLVNDPVLEAARLEAAYFAVALKLLMPTNEQVNPKEKEMKFQDSYKFSFLDKELYYFELPDFLKEDVNKEVELIRGGGLADQKSPVLRYRKDYKQFLVPGNYKINAKLNNFYLATRWLNSVFPLYYLSEECPECLLDKDDWLINMAAAGFITRDLSDNQDLKNQWAIVYKFISFFSGLRKDLTYLHYHKAYADIFGHDFSIEDIFAADNGDRAEDMARVQSGVAAQNFLAIGGSFNRDDQLADLGMRLLQMPYWPNDYIFDQLTGLELKSRVEDFPAGANFTSCSSDKGGFYYRCRGFGLDIVNFLSPISQTDDYWAVNVNYDVYNQRARVLGGQIDQFDTHAWNENIYWVTLDLAKSLLTYNTNGLPAFTKSANWRRDRDYNTVLGAWVNLHLPADDIVYFEGEKGSGLGDVAGCNMRNYIEPNTEFLRETMAKNNMIRQMITALKVTEKTHAAVLELQELDNKLQKILAISKKELSGEIINDTDCQFINGLVRHFTVDRKGKKDFVIHFPAKNLRESINGIKLLIVVYQRDNKKIMAIGPVFNYMER